MALKQVLEIYEMLDSAKANGEQVAALLRERGVADAVSIHIEGKTGGTDFVSGSLPGDGSGPTLGIIGRLGGVGARPAQIGMVSMATGQRLRWRRPSNWRIWPQMAMFCRGVCALPRMCAQTRRSSRTSPCRLWIHTWTWRP